MKNNFFVFFIIICCFLTASFFLSEPAGALDSGGVAITGNIRLIVFDITVTGIDTSYATVSWKTNGNSNSTVEYGPTTSYGSLRTNGIMAKDHTIYLHNLLPGMVYHFRVISGDPAGNRAVSADLTFTTTGPTPQPYPAPIFWGDGDDDGGGVSTNHTITWPWILQQPTLPQQPQQPTPPQQTQQPGPLEQPAAGQNAQNTTRQPTPQQQGQYPESIQIFQIPAIIIQALQSWWLASPILTEAILILIIIALALIAIYFGWRRKKKS